jgi:cell division topological specificity factor
VQEVLNWFFRTNSGTARGTAKDRMRTMLVNDRLELPAGQIEMLQEELVAVVSRYFDMEKDTTKFDLQQFERKASLVANFPLLRSKC